jgi:hypothetical protein
MELLFPRFKHWLDGHQVTGVQPERVQAGILARLLAWALQEAARLQLHDAHALCPPWPCLLTRSTDRMAC